MIKGLLSSLLLFSASTVLASEKISYTKEDLTCLTKNIYFEARNQDVNGKIAVAQVTLNRVKDSRYPNSICRVIKQGYVGGRKDCQFSWYCDGKSDHMTNRREKLIAGGIAKAVLEGELVDITKGSTHYHANYVRPYWSSSLIKISTIGDHIFYRWD